MRALESVFAVPSRRILWEVSRCAHGLGWARLFGLAMTMVALLASAAGILRSQRAAELERQFSALQAAGRAGGERAAENRPETLLSSLPPARSVPEQLGRLYAAAESSGTQLTTAEYRSQPLADAPVSTVLISMTLKDEYPKVQNLLIEALRRLDNASLESVTFRRPDRRQARVEARVNLVLYVRPEGTEGR